MSSEANQNIDKNKTVGLGVDIVDISRMRDILDKTPNFIEYTYTSIEAEYCQKSSRFVEHYATHFAAKEAVLKALGIGFAEGVGPKDVEVLHDEKGKPYVELYGRVKGVAEELRIKDIPISLSFTNNEAVGFAIALTEESAFENEVLKKSKDPMAELTKQFKEAKKILEENPKDFFSSENQKDKEDNEESEEN